MDLTHEPEDNNALLMSAPPETGAADNSVDRSGHSAVVAYAGEGVDMNVEGSDRDLTSEMLADEAALTVAAIGKFEGHNGGDGAAAAAGELADQNHSTQPPEPPGATVWEPLDLDILSGRGAKVNLHPGNARFRALCFKKQPEFVSGSHPIKRRIATEIVLTVKRLYNSRFLKKTSADGPWIQMDFEKSIAKASQVMRDYKRPDRLALREAKGGSKKRKLDSTPMDNVPVFLEPVESTVENPFGVHHNDILCGRGAYVNSHPGNLLLRQLATERKLVFENGTFTEKTNLAAEIVSHIRSLEPPGRFLKKSDATKGTSLSKGLAGEWEELSDEKAIHKACQVMRDILRPDRLERDLKRKMNKNRRSADHSGTVSIQGTSDGIQETAQHVAEGTAHEVLQQTDTNALEVRTQEYHGLVEAKDDAEAEAATEPSSLEIPGEAPQADRKSSFIV